MISTEQELDAVLSAFLVGADIEELQHFGSDHKFFYDKPSQEIMVMENDSETNEPVKYKLNDWLAGIAVSSNVQTDPIEVNVLADMLAYEVMDRWDEAGVNIYG